MTLWKACATLILAAATASAGLFWRDKLASLWSDKAITVNADDADWDESKAYEQEGISVMARNDGRDLYLLVTARTKTAREQLSGEAKQDLTLWFLKADGKTRDWGMRLPFSHRQSLTAALRDPAGIDPEPELVGILGERPAEIANRVAASARRPVWEIRVPLARLSPTPEKIVAVDLEFSKMLTLLMNLRLAAPPTH